MAFATSVLTHFCLEKCLNNRIIFFPVHRWFVWKVLAIYAGCIDSDSRVCRSDGFGCCCHRFDIDLWFQLPPLPHFKFSAAQLFSSFFFGFQQNSRCVCGLELFSSLHSWIRKRAKMISQLLGFWGAARLALQRFRCDSCHNSYYFCVVSLSFVLHKHLFGPQLTRTAIVVYGIWARTSAWILVDHTWLIATSWYYI